MARPEQADLRERWHQRIAQQESTNTSIRAFCRDHKLSEHSFYTWRQRLRADLANGEAALRFALVDAMPPPSRQHQHQPRHVELILTSGDRLHIPADATTLRLVLSALREQPERS